MSITVKLSEEFTFALARLASRCPRLICVGCMSFGDPEWQDWTLNAWASLGHSMHGHQLLRPYLSFVLSTADVYSNGVSEQIDALKNRELCFFRQDLVVLTTMVYSGLTPSDNEVLKRPKDVSDRLGKTTSAVALAW
ncbi:hypothetical protein BJ742DRAFT_742867 [Cladochytrium replicatum]|nr:hypothetical protein BJ742DRAFT_742867 [Cladochytrium replicatum]